jgi:cardiolipin synthase A/B
MLAWIGFIFFLLTHAAGVWGAIDVIMKGRTAQGTTAWALALLFVPWATLPFYLVFGERRFEGYIRARRDGVRQIDQAAASLVEELRPFARSLGGEHSDLTPLARLARLPFTGGNNVELLIDGERTFDAIFKAIEGASLYVLVQFYIIHDDQVGRRLAELLIAARARGVRVMVLYDEIGSYWLPRAYLDALTAAGCECSGFRTKPRKQKPFRINFRNHRKIVVVDGQTAFVGGLNIGREYLGLDPAFGPWRDTHLSISGPSVQCLQLSFLEDWYWANRRIPELRWTPIATTDAGSGVLIMPSGPADKVDTCSLMHIHIVNCARRRLWLATPYFVPDEELLSAIQLAALRGVDVRLIVPANNDGVMVHYSILSYFDDLFRVGVKVYQYSQGFMHQKVTLSDDLTVVGTANLDNRSFRINFEVSAIIDCEQLAKHTEAMLLADMQRSRLLSPEWSSHQSARTRFLSRFCRLFAPIQ